MVRNKITSSVTRISPAWMMMSFGALDIILFSCEASIIVAWSNYCKRCALIRTGKSFPVCQRELERGRGATTRRIDLSYERCTKGLVGGVWWKFNCFRKISKRTLMRMLGMYCGCLFRMLGMYRACLSFLEMGYAPDHMGYVVFYPNWHFNSGLNTVLFRGCNNLTQ